MEPDDEQAIYVAYTVSNVVGILILIAAFKRPRLARLLFVLLFGWAGWFNYITSHQNPQVYMMYADSPVGLYRTFINGWFSQHITAFVTAIAAGQLLIAIGMVLRNHWVTWACAGAITFLLGIAPLGIYAAFPFSIVVSAAALVIARNDHRNYLWKLNRKKQMV